MAPKKKQAAKANEAPIINGSQALQLKAALDAGQTLDDEVLLKLLQADSPCEGLYSKACKSKGQNPNCLCNIIPAPDAFRRAGLWAKNSDVTSGLGFDPSDRRREDPSTPAGLRNLGNTCYVNSVLQCLFANAEFRNAVYAAAPPVSEDPVVKALKDLFVQMQQGPASPVDPAPLATALQLDHAVQQDGQEFMKLLLTLLEHRFASQPNLHGVIQNLFRGQSGYETLCMTCNTPSESSSRSDNFYELDVPVRGFKSLDASLTTLLSPEILDGDNQFSCDRCAAKRDATRRLQIRSLPPMLCLSLQRFVYDFVKGDRVKASDKFAFPLELPASALVGGIEQQGFHEGGGEKEIYDLEAILIHKGGSALQGHYVAHIKLDAAPDGTGGTWWRFDDETVTKMEEGPFGTTDHGAGAGGLTGISNAKGASGSGSAGATAKKKPGGGAKKQTTKKGAGAGAATAGKKKKTGGKAAAAKTKKQAPAKKKGAGARKKRNEWYDSDDVVDSEANITDAEEEGTAAVAAAAVEEEEEDDELAMALKASLAGGANGGAEVVDLLKEETEEEKKKKRTEIVSSNAYLLVYRRRQHSVDDLAGATATAAGDAGATTIGELGGVLDPETAQWLEDSKARLAEEFEKQCEAYKTAKADAERHLTTRRQEVRNLLESASGYQNITSGNGGGPIGGPSDEVKEGDEGAKEEEEEKNKKPPRRGAAAATKTKPPPPTLESIFPDGDCGRFISATWLQQWADAPASSPPPPIDNAPLLCQHGKLDPSRPTVMRRLPTHAWTALASNYRGGPELKPCDACPVCLGEVLDSIAAAEDSSEAREYYLDVVELLLSSSNTIKEDSEEDDEIVDDDDDEERMEVEEENGGAGGTGGGRRRKAAQKKKTKTAAAAKPSTTTTAVPVTGVPAYYVSKPWLQAWLRRGGKSMGTTPPTQALCCPHGGLLPELQPSSSTKRIGISEDFWAFLKRSWQFSETERLRKVRAKAAEKLRKNQGGAAVLIDGGDSSKEKKEEEEVIMLDGEGEMVEIDGVQVFLPADTKEPTTIRGKKEEDDGDIEIVESPRRSPPNEEEQEAAAGAGGGSSGSKNATTSTAAVVSMDITPLPEFRIHTKECHVCCEEITKATQLSKGLHSRVQAEKASLSHLLTPGFLQLTQGETYYLIPRAFMDHWRAYMTQASIGRRGAVAAVAAGAGGATARSDFLEAPSLADYMKRAACDCHSDPHLLAFAPPQVVNRRGRWLVVNNSENTVNVAGVGGGGGASAAAAVEDPFGFFELISVADWSAFVEHYAEEELVFGVEGISATLHIEEVEKESVEDLEKKSDSPAAAVVDGGSKKGDEAMLDAPPLPLATATTINTVAVAAAAAAPSKRRTRAQDADLVDSDAQLAKALADVEAEDAKAAAKENGELESDSDEEERKGKRKKQSASVVVKKQAFKNLNEIDEEDDIIPVSQVDDEGAVFGQDPDFLYERKPGGNAHLRPGAAGKAWLITKPATCTATLEARQVAVKAARLSYTGAEIMVEISLTGDEAITATLAAVAAAAAAGGGGAGVGGSDVLGERKSKRARKGRAPVTVDCTSTLHDLRLRIYQAVGVHPRNARLYFRGRQISDKDEITLAELEIYPNEEIRVVDTQEHDPDDLTGLFLSSDSGKKGRRGGPEGFGGTALTGLHLVESNNDLGGGLGDIDMQ